ncbi:MAG: PIG-L deacetylase family protein [Chloroflexota bacterium]|nr:PIG-L deacetylase family protein [Chloroflexota bacterium]
MVALDTNYSRAMVVVAHADDAEWGCAGTVAQWCNNGWEVVYVLCTDGSKGTDDARLTSEELVSIRKKEQLDAGQVLGLHKVVFLDYEDSMLEPTLNLRRDIVRQIRFYKPDILICLSPLRRLDGSSYFGHPDHLASGEAALSAVFPLSRDRLTYPELLEEGLEPHKVSEVWIMGHDDDDKFVDVTDYIDVAVSALKSHSSQTTGEDVGQQLIDWRSRTGEKVGFAYAESFKRFLMD